MTDRLAPINQFESDTFLFAPVARDIVQFLARNSTPSPLTVGIEGPYGSGKTSLINLIKRDLQNTEVLDFSPWHSDSKPFHEQLLEQLAAAATSSNPSLASALRHYASQLSSTSIGKGALAAVRGSNNLSVLDTNDPKGVVNELIRGKGVNYLVVIDDIDRLLPDEISALLRLIRSTADFSNVRYLIAYDRSVLTASLSNGQDSEGRFMDKIVQVEMQLPHVPATSLSDHCIDVAVELLPNSIDAESIARLRARTRVVLGNLLATPREAVRTAFAVSLSFGRLERNIDFHDALIIGALRLRYPKFVRGMADMRDRIFVVPENQQGRNRWWTLASNQNTGKTELEIVLVQEAGRWGIQENNISLVIATMKHLFQSNSFAFDESFYSVRNVASFSRYFGFSVPNNTITEEVYTELMTAVGTRQEELIQKALHGGQFFSLCQRLENERKEPDEKVIELYFRLGRAEIKAETNWTNQVAAFYFHVKDRLIYGRAGTLSSKMSADDLRNHVEHLVKSGEYPYEYELRVCEGVLSEISDSYVLSKDYCEETIASFIEEVIARESSWNKVVEDALSYCTHRGWGSVGEGSYREQRIALKHAVRLLELARSKFGNRLYAKWFVRNNSPFRDQELLHAVHENAKHVHGDWDKFESHLRSLGPDESILELLELLEQFKGQNFQRFVRFDFLHLR